MMPSDNFDMGYTGAMALYREQGQSVITFDLRDIIPVLRDWIGSDDPILTVLTVSVITGATVPEILDKRVHFKSVKWKQYTQIGKKEHPYIVNTNLSYIRQIGKLYVHGQRIDIDTGTDRVFDSSYDCVKPVWLLDAGQALIMIDRVRSQLTIDSIVQIDTTFFRLCKDVFPKIHEQYTQQGWPLYRFTLIGLYLEALRPLLSKGDEDSFIHWMNGNPTIAAYVLVRSFVLNQPLGIQSVMGPMKIHPFDFRYYM
jgi:hypothetical protein